ncbi:MAG: hypothetical protein LLF76_15205 [Planctomycetaceae bacterium]|nr:hypothetical protein [Planctomycetaceae bacterium]
MRTSHLYILAILLAAAAAQAATVTFSTTAPVPGKYDVSNLTGATQDRNNIGGNGTNDGPANDATTYVAFDRGAQGQTFCMKPGQGGGFKLTGAWVRHVGYAGTNGVDTWYRMAAPSTIRIRITKPSAAGTPDFALANETYTITGTEPGVLPAATTNNRTGSGTWIHFALANPITLPASHNVSAYGFDVSSGTDHFFETHGIRDAAPGGNPYTTGTAYVCGSGGVPGNTMSTAAGDRVFVIELTPCAANPTPTNNGSADVMTNQLTWTLPEPNSPSGVITSNVYLGTTEPNFAAANYGLTTLVATGVTGNSVTIPAGTLQNNVQYYWIVDSFDSSRTPALLHGVTWKFLATSAPRITGQPESIYGYSGDTAVFTVEFESDSAVAAGWPKWYKDAAEVIAGGDSSISTVNTGGNQYRSKLTLANLLPANAGSYYCEVKNADGTRQSNAAVLTVIQKRLLGHWPLNTDGSDISGSGLNGTLAGSPVFSAGKVGTAMTFDGVDDSIQLPDGFADLTSGITFTVWAKPTAAGSFARFFDFGTGVASFNFGRSGTSNGLVLFSSVTQVPVDNAITLNEWQMFAVTMDHEGNVVIYRNAIPLISSSLMVPNIATRTPNYIGRSNSTADALFAGQMDDIQLTNYPKSADEILDMYVAVEGSVCLERPQYDLTGDCRVKFEDFALLAAHWLECGLYPTCP